MPNLRHSLSRMDFNHLKIVAEKWRLPFSAPDAREGLNQLVDQMLNPDLHQRIREVLSSQELEALKWLDAQGGREQWSHYIRRFGDLRDMGAGRLDRERPDQDPISPVEGLWYRALVARGFFETDTGPLEFAYIPDDIRDIVMRVLQPEINSLQHREFQCRKATTREKKHLQRASGICLDHICTLLAALRMNLDPDVQLSDVPLDETDFYLTLFPTMDLLRENGTPAPEKIREYFDHPIAEALLELWQSWRTSESNPDLALIQDLQIEGNPELYPRRVREFVIDLLSCLDSDTWWSIESFISQIKDQYPDFQRPGGDYDSWFIKRQTTGEYLRGYHHWDEVEGALIRYLLSGPLHWLGLLDLGLPKKDAEPAAFRYSSFAADLLENQPPPLPSRAIEQVQIRAKGEIRMTLDVPHKVRYQVARFCEWQPVKGEAYLYTISPASLRGAEKQGLRVAHLLSLLKLHTDSIPPNILAALERWEKQGVQASIGNKPILRLGSPAVLKSLNKTRASRFILEQLGPTAVIIREGSEDKIKEVLVELGFFLELED